MMITARGWIAREGAFLGAAALSLMLCLAAMAQSPAQAPAGRGPQVRVVVNNPPPVVAYAHWHDVTLNVVEPLFR